MPDARTPHPVAVAEHREIVSRDVVRGSLMFHISPARETVQHSIRARHRIAPEILHEDRSAAGPETAHTLSEHRRRIHILENAQRNDRIEARVPERQPLNVADEITLRPVPPSRPDDRLPAQVDPEDDRTRPETAHVFDFSRPAPEVEDLRCGGCGNTHLPGRKIDHRRVELMQPVGTRDGAMLFELLRRPRFLFRPEGDDALLKRFLTF